MNNYSSYLPMSACRQGLVAYADGALKALKDVEYDAIVVRGVSGITVGTLVAVMANKSLVIARKPYEDSHGGPIEGPASVKRCVFIDDLVASGRTLRASFEAVRQVYPTAWFVGAYLYNWAEFKNEAWLVENDYIKAHHST